MCNVEYLGAEDIQTRAQGASLAYKHPQRSAKIHCNVKEDNAFISPVLALTIVVGVRRQIVRPQSIRRTFLLLMGPARAQEEPTMRLHTYILVCITLSQGLIGSFPLTYSFEGSCPSLEAFADYATFHINQPDCVSYRELLFSRRLPVLL